MEEITGTVIKLKDFLFDEKTEITPHLYCNGY